MTIYVNENGTWIPIQQPYVYDDSVWRQVSNQYVNEASTWRKVFPDVGELWTWGEQTNDSFTVAGNNSFTRRDLSTPVTTSVGGINWTQVATGKYRTAGIKDDGTLWTWGHNNNLLHVANSLGLGRIATQSLYSIPQIQDPGSTDWADTPTSNAEDLHTVSSGGRVSGAIKTDGTLWMWGPNDVGQLGIPSFPLGSPVGISSYSRETPVTTFSGGTNWKQISCGYQHAGAVKTDGTLWMWGYNGDEALGTQDAINRSTPVTTFAGGTNWKQVSCGQSHTLAIKTDGTLWVWGSNDGGKLGVFNRSSLFGNVNTPATTFTGGTDWNNCSAGHSHSSAVKTDGTLWTWGRTSIDVTRRVNEQDEPYTDLGDRLGRLNSSTAASRVTFSQRLTPVTTFTGGTNWLDTPTSNPDLMSSISVGFDHSAAIKTDGTLWLWGSGSGGQLGNARIFATPTSQLSVIGSNWGYATPITTFSGGTNWKQVSCGSRFTAAIKTDGTLWMWGSNTSSGGIFGGWLGLNNNPQITQLVSTPVTTFVGGNNWKQVSCGFYHVGAVKTDGTLWMWGNGLNFKLAQGVNSSGVPSWSRPTQPVVSTDWKQVSCGREHTAAIKTDGTLWVWGNVQALGNAKPSTQFPMSTPMTTFAGGNNWKQVSCGSLHTSAVKTDGTLWTWGNTYLSTLGNNTILSSIISTPVTTFVGGTDWAYVNDRAAIKTDGTLWTWGTPIGGALGNNFQAIPTNIYTNTNSFPMTTFAGGTNWTQVQRTQSEEGSHVMGLKTDGTLWVWGNNRNGQLGINRNNSSFDPNFTDWDANSNLSTPLPNTTFTGGNNWKQVSCGRFHTAAVKTDGTLWTWGHNSIQGSVVGALGHNANSTVSRTETPITTLAGGNNWKQVSCGPYNTSAVKTDGTLWIWGENTLKHDMAYFQSTSYPITVAGGGNDWTQVSIGSSSHVTALKTDGTLWTWGNSFASTRVNTGTKDYLFGIKTKDALVPNPVESNNWKQVAISKNSNVGAAIKTDGTLWLWGSGSLGSLGRNADVTNSLTPVTTFVGGNDWKQVSLSGSLSFNGCTVAAVKTDGTLWMWGYNPSSNIFGANISISFVLTPITTFIGGNDWKSVNLSERCAAAIKTDGTLWVWGNNFNSKKISESDPLTVQHSIPTTTALGGTNWKKVAIGDYSISALKTDGTLWTWGNNSNGGAFLGRGDANSYRLTPITTFAGGTDWADTPTSNAEDLYTISANTYSTAAIKTDGTLWTWGYNQHGQLGKEYNILDVRVSTPMTTFAGGTNWKQVSCGREHTAAIKTDGTLWVWGNNGGGRLGSYPDILTFHESLSLLSGGTPVTTFVGGTNWKQVSCGRDSTAAIKTDGTLWFWGYNKYTANPLSTFSYNHLVNRSTFAITPITTFAGGTDWADTPTSNAEDLYTISSGSRMNGAIKTDGTLWTWGNNTSYGFGLLNQGLSQTPTQILPGTTWRQISCSINKGAAIKTDGTLWLWGRGSNGDLGNAVFQSSSTPVTTFAGGNNWKQVSATSLNCGAIKTDGTLWMWGQASYGKLGNNFTSGSRSTPVTTFAGGTNWKQVSCGLDSTVAIKTDGSLWRWGRCAHGLGGPFTTATNNAAPTSLGANSPGSVAWKQVSSAYRHAAGIKTDGTLWTWGNLELGRLGNNSDLLLSRSTPITTFAGGNNWKQVACGGNATAAIKTDGTLWTWGLFPLGNNRYSSSAYNLNYSLTPVTTFAGGTNWSQVFVSSASNNSITPSGHIIARKTDGTLWTWGNSGTLGSEYELALGADISDPTIPQKPRIFGDDWNQISIHVGFGGGVKTDGTLWMWGNNTNWQLGNSPNNFTQSVTTTTPVTTFAGGTNWKQVSCGYYHAAAITSFGRLVTWGSSSTGALGGNALSENRAYPTDVVPFSYGWKQVSCSTVFGLVNSFTAAVKTDGTLWTWGNNSYGQLGLNNVDYKLTPVTTFTGGTNWTQVYCGERHITALKTDGTLWTWGGVQYEGGISSIPVLSSTLGATSDQKFFGTVDGLWKDVSTQEASLNLNVQATSGVKMDGTLWMWGRSQHGALGDAIDSNYVSRVIPVTTALGGNNWVSVDVGGDRISAVKKTGL